MGGIKYILTGWLVILKLHLGFSKENRGMNENHLQKHVGVSAKFNQSTMEIDL